MWQDAGGFEQGHEVCHEVRVVPAGGVTKGAQADPDVGAAMVRQDPTFSIVSARYIISRSTRWTVSQSGGGRKARARRAAAAAVLERVLVQIGTCMDPRRFIVQPLEGSAHQVPEDEGAFPVANECSAIERNRDPPGADDPQIGRTGAASCVLYPCGRADEITDFGRGTDAMVLNGDETIASRAGEDTSGDLAVDNTLETFADGACVLLDMALGVANEGAFIRRPGPPLPGGRKGLSGHGGRRRFR